MNLRRLTALAAIASTLSITLSSGGAHGVEPAAAESTPIVYAHRGGAGEAPENTMGAFTRAWSLYGDRGIVLELDVWLAADGVLVVHHDDTLDRTTDCEGPIVAFTSVELADCDATVGWDDWSSEGVPTFADVLAAGVSSNDAGTGTWRIMPELKGAPGTPGFDPTDVRPAEALVGDLLASGYPLDAVIVQSFWPGSLDAVDALLATTGRHVDTALLTSPAIVANPQIGFAAHQNVLFSTMRQYEVSAPRHDAIDLDPSTAAAVIAAAHAAGRQVVPYTVDNPDRMNQLADAGIDGIITNQPSLALDTLDG